MSAMECRAAKIALYFALLFVNYVFSHVILFNPLNTKGVYIRTFEMLLSNQRRVMSYAKLSAQTDIKPKLQFGCQRRIIISSFVFYQLPLRLLKTFGLQAKITYKGR